LISCEELQKQQTSTFNNIKSIKNNYSRFNQRTTLAKTDFDYVCVLKNLNSTLT